MEGQAQTYLPFSPQTLILTHQEKTAFENIVGKGKIARNEQFLLFPQCFLLHQISLSPFVYIFDIISLLAVELEESKIGISDRGLKYTPKTFVLKGIMKLCKLIDKIKNLIV